MTSHFPMLVCEVAYANSLIDLALTVTHCAEEELDMLQQLEYAGAELQEDETDAVLERCEQLSMQLREALTSQGIQR